MEIFQREVCEITGARDLEPLHVMPNFPVFMGCTDQPISMDLRLDLSWSISKSSGLIQLKNLLPLEVLYPASHGAGAIGSLWKLHHKSFAKFISKFSPTSVLEIGGAHGILAVEYLADTTIPWTIVEPNPSPVDGCNATFIKGFFDNQFRFPGFLDTVVHSHVLEHMYNPDSFMRHLSLFLNEGKRLIFSIPNMEVMLERKYTNCINFEHTLLLTEPYVEYLLAKHGFRILAREYFMADHSIFYAAVKDTDLKPTELSLDLYDKYRKLYLDYLGYHKKQISDLNKQLEVEGGAVYLFGAHVFSQYLIEMGLNTQKIICLLDNDPAKQGRRLYGTNLSVCSPKALSNDKRPYVILRAGVYTEEIKTEILGNINDSTVFLD